MANSPARSVIDVGSVIAGTYTIEGLVGRGGMGSVFLASHNRLPGKQVAIKLLHAELVDDDVLARFRREAEIASKLGHPNIVVVHDFNITDDGTPYLVLEYLEGESLAQRLKAGPLTVEQTMAILRQVCGALAAAHREGIVHRDLKPHNIFLVPTEVGDAVIEVAKVLDFGISKIRGSQTVKTQESALLGTPQYMAPEQATGQHDKVDERTDVFALGAIAFEMLVGRPAFSGASIPEVVFKVVYEQPAAMPSTLPEPIAQAIRTAMEKDPDRRFATVGAFVEALTGSPLVSGIRAARASMAQLSPPSNPLPSSGSGRGKRIDLSQDAFANTMGSGDYGAGDAQTEAPVSVRGSAPTVDSQSRALVPEPAPTARTSAPGQTSPRARRPVALIVGAALACAAGLGAATFYALRSSSEPEVASPAPGAPPVEPVARPSRAEVTPSNITSPKVTPPKEDVTPPKAEVTPSKVTPPKVTPPKVTPPKATPPKPVVDPPDEDADDDIDARAQLTKAEAALVRADYEVAIRLANSVVNSNARPRQLAQAYAIRGIGECVARNNEEGALANLRAMVHGVGGKQRLRLIRICHQHGLLQSVR